MAVLGKIRSKGALLVGIIGLGLFSFIAEEAFRSCESTKNNERQQIAEVLGEKLTYQEFMEMVDEYTEVRKLTMGRDNFTEDELNSIRDNVWSTYLRNALIENEAKKLGLKVTDDEIRDILNEGTHEFLRQTPFFNPQTNRFDANKLKQFLSEYKKAQSSDPQALEQLRPVYNYWKFTEKTFRQELLASKYEALLYSSILSNKVEAKQSFNEENVEASIVLAAFPYSSMKDEEIKVTDDDLNAKYNELKPRFQVKEETRDIKFVSVKVTASNADRALTNKTVSDFAQQLATVEDPSEVIRKSGSVIPYIGVPVLKSAYPADIQAQLDSIAVGTVSKMKSNLQDNTLNVVRLISKQELPDSVEFQTIRVSAESIDASRLAADSVMKAVAADATQWEVQAKKYGQTGEKQWLTTNDYQNASSLDADTKGYLTALNTMSVGETRNIATNMGNIIVKVTDRKAFQTKYVAAVIKTPMDFSKDTYSKAYNKFSQFVSENQTIEGLEKNAKKYGYTVEEMPNIVSGQHLINRIHGTHEALKWVFEAKAGDVSPLYECGENDNLLVIALTNVNKKGYLTLDNKDIKDIVKDEVIKDKKAEAFIAKAKGLKTIAEAKSKGAVVDTIRQITFSSPVYVRVSGGMEPALSGAVAATKLNTMSAKPVKGNAGVYVFNVASKNSRAMEYKGHEKDYLDKMASNSRQYVTNVLSDLYRKAEIKDNRYLFF